MTERISIRFADTDAPLDLIGCPELVDLAPHTLPYWPFARSEDGSDDEAPFMSVEKIGDAYHVRATVRDKEKIYRDPIDVMCYMIAELAWAGLRANPDWLCVHGAAVEFSGKLVLFPNTKRAGKSTLTACLSACGNRVFTDDFLPVSVDGDGTPKGIASGVGPRLRLPFPKDFSARFRDFFNATITAPGQRYGYLRLDRRELAPRGERLPFGAIVLLDRTEGSGCELLPASKADVLSRIIVQNFARAQDASRILRVLHYIVSHAPLYTLRYSSAEDAAGELTRHFARWPENSDPAPPFEEPQANSNPVEGSAGSKGIDLQTALVRCPTATELLVEGQRFIVDSQGYGIHRLDPISGSIWTALAQPALASDIIEMFRVAFPDEPVERLTDDVTRLLRSFAAKGLIRPKS